MSEPMVLQHVDGRVALLTLNHPARRNALSRAMLQALRERLAWCAQQRSIKVVILGANGTVFSSGHDLRELSAVAGDEADALFAQCSEVMEAVRLLPQPVIAKVQGLATAAGCQLAATCDLIVAADIASFATPGVKIGLFCTTPAVALCRAVPAKKALEMLFTGEPITATEAERVGLVNRVVPADRLDDETWSLARKIASASTAILSLGKRAFYRQLPLDYPAAYGVANPVMTENLRCADAQEGLRAFLDKRSPQWQD
jgi:enoyl-CoA hydratase/carnithine racemase